MSLEISDIQLKDENGCKELSALVDGSRVFYQIPSEYALYLKAEGFIALALMEAMCRNEPVVVDPSVPVSQQLLDRLQEIQSIYSSWNSDLSIIEIQATASADVAGHQLVGSFFSAGVDSSHTLIGNLQDISHLIMCWGFDEGSNEESWKNRVTAQSRFAESVGKKLLPVVSNARDWTNERMISWRMAHGLFLCSVGDMLGMKRVFIPSSHSYNELFPWGTHPLSDPMWSTESTEIIHHGAASSRSGKLKEVLKNPAIADNLQVCWENIDRNCGHCSKCVRMMAAIHMLGGDVQSLPPLKDFQILSALKPEDEGLAGMVEDLLILAQETNNTEIRSRLIRYYRLYQLKRICAEFDRYCLGGMLRRLHRRIRKPTWQNWRVTIAGPNSLDT
jgi:hypothetical protein